MPLKSVNQFDENVSLLSSYINDFHKYEFCFYKLEIYCLGRF